MKTGFANNEMPFSQHFADSLYIFGNFLTTPSILAIVDQKHPDVVIEEMVQRHIKGVPPNFVPSVTSRTGLSQSLKRSDQASPSSLDNINSESTAKTPIHVPGDKDISFFGWAVDEPNKTLAGGVDVVIDSAPYSAAYSISRQDVADHFKNPAYRVSGFRLDVPPGTLSKGQHIVSVRAITTDRKSYYQGPTVKFNVD
jgi:hypothetical protein